MLLQTYHLCQVVGQAFQTIPSYKKCKNLKVNWIKKCLFQTFFRNSPKFIILPPSFFCVFHAVCQSY